MTTAAQTPRLTTLSHGAGCACKLPLATLEALMASIGPGLGGGDGGDLLGRLARAVNRLRVPAAGGPAQVEVRELRQPVRHGSPEPAAA